MNPFTNILVPTDFSAPAERALEYAIELADKFGATLTLFHATGSPASSFSADAKSIAWSSNDARKTAEDSMRVALSKAQKRCPKAEAYVVEGDPWEAVPRFARTSGADLIVMGTHGRRGISHALFGSVAEKVLHKSPIPILTISGRSQEEAPTIQQSETRTSG